MHVTNILFSGLLLTVILASALPAISCTVEIVSPHDEFRLAKNVFIGRVVKVQGISNTELPEKLSDWNTLDKVSFKIEKSWKGHGTGQIDVFSNVYCICPSRLLKFDIGKRFLIYSDKRSMASACSLRIFDIDDPKNKANLERETQMLSNFWFRTWARIYPF